MGRVPRITYPSLQTSELLRKLRESVKSSGWFHRKQDPRPYLTALVEAGEPGVLRDLIWFALAADPEWQPEFVSAVASITSSAHVLVVGLFASHPNGYVREAAVVRLSQIEDTSELSLVPVRSRHRC